MSWLSNTLGNIAGSVLGNLGSSEIQSQYNENAIRLQNELNVDNYKHRYQWAVDDMRAAGLNPILAATNGIGGSISGASAGTIGMSDIGANTNSARSSSAAMKQAEIAENLSASQIEKNIADADSTRQSTHGIVIENGIRANQLNLAEQTYEKRLGYELQRMDQELQNLRLQGSYLSSGILSNIAAANQANSASAFSYQNTRLSKQEADFYDSLGGSNSGVGHILRGIGYLFK